MRIAYFGLPLGALALARAGHLPCFIGLGHPDAPGARRLRHLAAQKALIVGRPDLSCPRIQKLIHLARPDVLMSWFWPTQVPQTVLAMAPRGAFGVHPSLLPRWRGPDPYFWAIDQGDAETGVTLHRLAADYDTGEVIAQKRMVIGADDNAWTLAKKLDRPSLALFVEAARRLAAGEALWGTTQDEAVATYAPQPTDELIALDWRQPAEAVLRRVRALAPWPGALAEFGDTQVEVLRARMFEENLPKALEPGDAVSSAQGVVVRTGTAGVLLERVRDGDGVELRGPDIQRLFPGGLFRLSPSAV